MGILTQPINVSSPVATKVWYNYMPKQSNPTTASWGRPTSMIYANSIYAFVTDTGYVFYSTDGKNWAYQRPSTSALYGIAFGNNAWVIVGAANTCFSASTPGGTWTARTSQVNTSGNINDVLWVPNWSLFVLAGDTDATTWNMISTSPDGTTWTARAAMPGSLAAASTNIAWDGASTVVIGETITAATQGWSSTNGTTWTRIDINGAAAYGTSGPINYYGGSYGRFVAGSSRSQTPASVTTAWVSGTNYLTNNTVISPGTMAGSSSTYKPYKPYFDTTRNYCYQAMLANSSSATYVPTLITMDMSTTYTSNTSNNNVYFPVIKTEVLPIAASEMSSAYGWQNQFYAFLNGQHFYISNYRSSVFLTINSTIVP